MTTLSVAMSGHSSLEARISTRRPAQRKSSDIPETLNQKNDHLTHQIERSLLAVDEYKVNNVKNQLRYRHEFEAPKHKGMGEIEVLISGLPDQESEKITAALESLGDACRDTFVAIFGLYVLNNGTSSMRNNF